MAKTMSLWAKVETAPERAAVFSWKLRFGKDFPLVSSWLFKKANGRAQTVPCPKACGCFHRVNEDNLAYCECGDCEEIELSPEDVQLRETNWDGLGARLMDAYGLNSKSVKFSVPRVWQIGVHGSDSLPVILIVQPERARFNEAIAQLVAKLDRPFAVLTPTSNHDDIESQELLGRGGGRLFALDSDVRLTSDGRLVAKTGSADLFAALVSKPVEDLNDEVLRKAYAQVLLAAKEQPGNVEGPLKEVFDLYCMKDFSAREIGVKLKCSKATIVNRLAEIRKLCGGVSPVKLRTHKPFFERMERDLADHRASRLRRKNAIYGDDPVKENG